MRLESIWEFVVFAQYLNFSKAAKKLYMSQSLLSRHIAGLEKELGFTLVERGSALHLTAAGARFLAWAETFKENYEEALAECGALAEERHVTLVVERPAASIDLESRFEMLISLFCNENPDIDVVMVINENRDLIDVLTGGVADLGVVLDSSVLDDRSGITVLPTNHIPLGPEAFRGNCFVLMHEDNPLCSRESLTLGDLDGYAHVMSSAARYQIAEKCLANLFEREGIHIRVHHRPISYLDCNLTINDDEFILLSAEDISRPLFKSIRHRAVKKLECDQLVFNPCFVCSSGNENPAVQRFELFLSTLRTPS